MRRAIRCNYVNYELAVAKSIASSSLLFSIASRTESVMPSNLPSTVWSQKGGKNPEFLAFLMAQPHFQQTIPLKIYTIPKSLNYGLRNVDFSLKLNYIGVNCV